MENFLEIQELEQANKVNLDIYSFVAFSDKRGYIFKVRRKRLGK